MNITVSYIVLFTLIVASVKAKSTPEFKSQIKPLADECRKKINISDKDFEAVLNLQDGTSMEGKCLMGCIQEKVGFVKDGVFLRPKEALVVYRKVFASDNERLAKADYVVTTCVNKAKSTQNSCEAAYTVAQCVLDSP